LNYYYSIIVLKPTLLAEGQLLITAREMPAQIEMSSVSRTWGAFWDYFGKKLVHILEIKRGAQILDIGTGGGSTLFRASKRVGPTGKVIGVELCEHCMKKQTVR
jgi:tRNA G46 methylase TrmB